MPAPAEPASSWDLFRQLLPASEIDALDPRAPQAVYTASVVLWLLVFQRLNKNASLSEAVSQLAQGKAAGLQGLSPATGAYSSARSALDKGVLRWATRRSYDSLLGCYPPSFRKKRVFILDGTSVTLAPTKALKQEYPPATNQHGPSAWPVLRLLAAHDLDSGLAVGMAHGPMYGPASTSEQALAREVLPCLPAGSILLADRNFGVFSVAWMARQAGHPCLARLTGERFEALRKQARRSGPGRWKVCWKPSRADRKADPALPADAQVGGWLHEVECESGVVLLLFTTVKAPGRELAGLYKKRGDIETDIRDLKQTLCLAQVSGKGEEMVEKELLAAWLAYNLANQVRRLAAAKAGVPPRRLGFAATWALAKAFLGALAEGLEGLGGEEADARFERLLRQVGRVKLPRRPPGRSYPREVLGRASPYPRKKKAPPPAQQHPA